MSKSTCILAFRTLVDGCSSAEVTDFFLATFCAGAFRLAPEADSSEVRTERGRVLEVLGRVALWRGDYLQVIAVANEAIAIYGEQNLDQESAWALHLLASAEYYRHLLGPQEPGPFALPRSVTARLLMGHFGVLALLTIAVVVRLLVR